MNMKRIDGFKVRFNVHYVVTKDNAEGSLKAGHKFFIQPSNLENTDEKFTVFGSYIPGKLGNNVKYFNERTLREFFREMRYILDKDSALNEIHEMEASICLLKSVYKIEDSTDSNCEIEENSNATGEYQYQDSTTAESEGDLK